MTFDPDAGRLVFPSPFHFIVKGASSDVIEHGYEPCRHKFKLASTAQQTAPACGFS